MTTPQITTYDVLTSETVTRDFNVTELAQLEKDILQADKDAQTKTKTDKELADKRQTILDRLGLTVDEFKTLIG